jgi:hypothetical protein
LIDSDSSHGASWLDIAPVAIIATIQVTHVVVTGVARPLALAPLVLILTALAIFFAGLAARLGLGSSLQPGPGPGAVALYQNQYQGSSQGDARQQATQQSSVQQAAPCSQEAHSQPPHSQEALSQPPLSQPPQSQPPQSGLSDPSAIGDSDFHVYFLILELPQNA